MDWQLTVITAPAEPKMPRDNSLLEELPPATKILRTPVVAERSGLSAWLNNRLSRGYWQRWLSALVHITDSRKGWNRQALDLLNRELQTEEYDCLIISSPPYSLVQLAAEMKASADIPVILDLRDPWTTNPYKIYPSGLHRLLDRRREQKYIAGIDNLISVYHTTFEHFDKTIPGFQHKSKIVILAFGDHLAIPVEQDVVDFTKD